MDLPGFLSDTHTYPHFKYHRIDRWMVHTKEMEDWIFTIYQHTLHLLVADIQSYSQS